MIDVVVERSAGLDIAKASLVACVRTRDERGRWKVQKRKFATTTRSLLELRDWLAAENVTRVGMESTGDYWKPIFYVLEEAFECWLLNARHMRAVPGRKTDMTDAEWICDLVAHGLVRPSFVPPAPIRRLRDLTRRRSTLITERGREKSRLEKLLEDAGVKLSIVATDFVGKSGRTIIEALIAGERDPGRLADLAMGLLRKKLPALTEALTGRFDDHHAFLARHLLDHIDAIDTMICDLEARIEIEAAPYQEELELLDTINGVNRRSAVVIIAEIGVDMHQFATAAHLASWAAVCPGNNKTAGKDKPTPTRHGDRWLKSVLGTAALAAIRKKDSYATAQFRRIATRRGGKRALTAVGHSLLIAAWHVLNSRAPYTDLGGDHLANRQNPDHRRRKLINELERLGYAVTLEPAT